MSRSDDVDIDGYMEKSLVKWLKMVTESPMVICGGICWEICRPKLKVTISSECLLSTLRTYYRSRNRKNKASLLGQSTT